MTEEIFEQLKKEYNTAKLMMAAKWLSEEMEGNEAEEEKYDVPLLTIYFKDYADEAPIEHPLLQVRVRDDCEGRGEEFVMVFTNTGASKIVNDVDEDLKFCSQYVEKFTEEFIEKFPDAVLRYQWGNPE